MTISPELFNAIVGWMERHPNRDMPSMRLGAQELSPRQIVNELEASSETGLALEAMLKDLIRSKGQAFVIESFKQ